MATRILLIAALDEPVTSDSRSDAAGFAFELATALAQCADDTGEVAADLVARRGSRTPLPLVSVDPGELLSDGSGEAEAVLAEEAILTQLALAGLLEGYEIVHILSPMVGVVQLAAAQGSAIVQSIAQSIDGGRGSAAKALVSRLVVPERLAQTGPPAGVDLNRFRPVDDPRRDFALWLGSGEERAAREASASLDLPLRTFGDNDIVALLQHARVLLHAGPEQPLPLWPLRAVACGTDVAGWIAVPSDPAGRRQLALARFGSRAMAGRYRETYRDLIHA
jgi:hypothetical protein